MAEYVIFKLICKRTVHLHIEYLAYLARIQLGKNKFSLPLLLNMKNKENKKEVLLTIDHHLDIHSTRFVAAHQSYWVSDIHMYVCIGEI